MPLNEAQQQIVTYVGGHSLIVAAPGTGKTYTLAKRIAFLAESIASPRKVLGIAFNQQAAAQMLGLLKSDSIRLDSVSVGTFHDFCLSLLRRHIALTPLPNNFKIASPHDIQDILNELWPTKSPQALNDILEQIVFIKSTELILESTPELFSYQKLLRLKGFIDLEDILREALMLLENHDELLVQWASEFPYIIIDEYQELNKVKQALLKLLAKAGCVITAAGDPHTSVTSVSGGEVEIFHQFEDDYINAKIFYLKENYRLSPNIINAGLQVIEEGSRQGVPLSISKVDFQGKVIAYEATTDRAEAEYIAHVIERMGSINFGSVAILCRLESQFEVIRQALEHVSIPYTIAQKPVVFEEEAHLLAQREGVIPYDISKVSILTLEASHGLEFNVVFIVGCEDRLIPLDLIALKGELKEERRLFYLGMTRAKKELYLTFAKRRQLFGQAYALAPSPFLQHFHQEIKLTQVSQRKKVVSHDDQLKLF